MIQQAINKTWRLGAAIRTAAKYEQSQDAQASAQAHKTAQADELHAARMQRENIMIQRQELALQQAQNKMEAKTTQRKRMSIQRALRDVPIGQGQDKTQFKFLPKQVQDAIIHNLTPEMRKAYIEDAKLKGGK